MNQKCRYCANCIVGDAVYCEAKGRTMSEQSAKRANKCKSFEFNRMDAFGDKDYQEPKPEQSRKDECEQIALNV